MVICIPNSEYYHNMLLFLLTLVTVRIHPQSSLWLAKYFLAPESTYCIDSDLQKMIANSVGIIHVDYGRVLVSGLKQKIPNQGKPFIKIKGL